jgi:hypothetical protein
MACYGDSFTLLYSHGRTQKINELFLKYIITCKDCASVLGYSLGSGRFMSTSLSHYYVAGSPRNADFKGKVCNLGKYFIHINEIC